MGQATRFWEGERICHDFIYPRASCRKTQPRFVIQNSVQKKSSTENRGKTSRKRFPALLRGGRLSRCCFLSASRRISAGSGSFRCGRTRYFSRGRRRGRGSRSCRGRDSFSFLLARREKRGPSQYADVFLHNWSAHCFNRSIAASAVFGPLRMLLETEMARYER